MGRQAADFSAVLRREALRCEPPERVQDATMMPIGDFGFEAGLANAVNSGQQQVAGGGGTGAGFGPE